MSFSTRSSLRRVLQAQQLSTALLVVDSFLEGAHPSVDAGLAAAKVFRVRHERQSAEETATELELVALFGQLHQMEGSKTAALASFGVDWAADCAGQLAPREELVVPDGKTAPAELVDAGPEHPVDGLCWGKTDVLLQIRAVEEGRV